MAAEILTFPFGARIAIRGSIGEPWIVCKHLVTQKPGAFCGNLWVALPEPPGASLYPLDAKDEVRNIYPLSLPQPLLEPRWLSRSV